MAARPRKAKGDAEATSPAPSPRAKAAPRSGAGAPTGFPKASASKGASPVASRGVKKRAGFVHATGAVGPLLQIERLRAFRPGVRGADSISSEVERFARELAKHEHAAGGLARAWSTLAPQAIQQVTRVDRLHGGVLTVVASDASAKYDAEMWLAEGGLVALRGVAARTLRRVKVTIG